MLETAAILLVCSIFALPLAWRGGHIIWQAGHLSWGCPVTKTCLYCLSSADTPDTVTVTVSGWVGVDCHGRDMDGLNGTFVLTLANPSPPSSAPCLWEYLFPAGAPEDVEKLRFQLISPISGGFQWSVQYRLADGTVIGSGATYDSGPRACIGASDTFLTGFHSGIGPCPPDVDLQTIYIEVAMG